MNPIPAPSPLCKKALLTSRAVRIKGPYFLGRSLSLVDVHLAPFALRLGRVLRPLCGLPVPAPGTRLRRWLDALEGDAHVRSTTSADELYLDTAEMLKRCAEALAE